MPSNAQSGVYTFLPDLSSFFLTFLQGLVCMLLFAFTYRRRKFFFPRLIGCTAGGLLLCIAFALWKAPYGQTINADSMFCRIATYTLLTAYILWMLWFCYEESFTECTLCWAMTVSVVTFAGQSYAVLLNFCGIDDKASVSFFEHAINVRDYLLLALYHIAVFALFAVLFARRTRLQKNMQTSASVAVLAAVIVLISYVLGAFSRVYEDANTSMEMVIITKLFKVICSVFVISLALGVLQRNKLTQDLEITEQLLQQEKVQFEMSKETVEAINMKCHDLKHRLDSFEHKLNEEELLSLKEAIDIYDSNIKTNNQVLDVVLYEKQLICSRNGIRLSCMANGALLSFMTPSHIYSLFGNAVDNAIEAVRQIGDADKRMIDISLTAEGENASIEISNYFSGERKIENGLPVTTKEDANRHGYGMKSMRYIVEQYRGTLRAQTRADIFMLQITLPQKTRGFIRPDCRKTNGEAAQ